MVDPKRKLQDLMQRSDELSLRVQRAVNRVLVRRKEKLKGLDRLDRLAIGALQLKKQKLKSLMGMLGSLSPLNVLERGYAITSDDKDKVITDASSLKIDQSRHF